MNTQLAIPTKIHVGQQERSDTYTGKLGYVIYTDEKGVKRKAGSWESWRDKEINPLDFDNIPTSGFVLNRNGGGHGGGWDARRAFIRVYDPRDFEFEISVPNLLYILQECTSTKGKGLEGEFVYAWDGKELVLLPTTTLEYQNSLAFTDLKSMKVNLKELKIGATYLTKNQQTWIYLGKMDYHTFGYYQRTPNELTAFRNAEKAKNGRNYYRESSSDKTDYAKQVVHTNKLHIFVDENGKYEVHSSGAKLAKLIDENQVPNYAELLDVYYKTTHGSPIVELIYKEEPSFVAKTNNRYTWREDQPEVFGGKFRKLNDNEFQLYSFEEEYDYSNGYKHAGFKGRTDSIIRFDGTLSVIDVNRYSEKYFKNYTKTNLENEGSIKAMNLGTLYLKFQSGIEIKYEKFIDPSFIDFGETDEDLD